MSDAPDLSRKVGPAPLGVWIAAVLGGVGWGLYRRRKASAAPTAAADASTATDPGIGNPSGPLPVVDPTTIPDAPDTNEAWRILAERRLVSGGFGPVAVDAALAHYLAGDQLTTTEGAIIAAALTLAGPAPLAPPPPHVTGPISAPPPAPTPHAIPHGTWPGAPVPASAVAPHRPTHRDPHVPYIPPPTPLPGR